MPPYVGRGGAIGAGEESSWGSEASRTKWWPVESNDLERALRREPVAVLVGASGAATRREHYAAEEMSEGTIRLPWSYQDMGLLLKHALGSSSSGTPSGGLTAHTYSLAASLPAGLTLESVRGNNSGGAEEFYGGKINLLRLSCEANGYMVGEIGVMAKTGGTRASGSSPTYATPYRILHSHAGQMGFNSANYRLRRFTLTVDNKLAKVNELGSLYTAEPERGDYTEILFEAELHYTGDALYTAHLAGTESDLTLTFTDPVNNYVFAITVHNAVIHECAAPVNGVGLLTQRVVFRGYTDGTNHGVSIVVTNSQSTATE